MTQSLVSSTGARLVTADGRTLALRAVALDVDAGHGLASVRVRQTFENRFDEPLHVTYQLPLPADAAVIGYTFQLGDRRITGCVKRRDDARAAFETAVIEGRTAALLEQDRSSLFTQAIGNLPPGATLEVEIDVEQPLCWSAALGGWTWRFPTVVAPRYLGAPGQTPDPEVVARDLDLDAPKVPCAVTVTVTDPTTGPPTSPSHALTIDDTAVALSGTLDRDVVLSWPVAAPEPSMTIEVARRPEHDDATGSLVVVPPTDDTAAAWPRDLTVLIDASGSMSGAPIAQLKALTQALIRSLSDHDQLEIIVFANEVRRWRASPSIATAEARADALAYIDALRATGGTDMHRGILAALGPLRPDANRQILLMTDGLIGFESEILGHIRRELPPRCRVHTVAVGSAPNRTLTAGAARAGGGHEIHLDLDADVTAPCADLLAHTARPLLVDLEVSGTAVRGVAPRRVPDVLRGSPARVALCLDPAGGSVIVTAHTPSGTFRQTRTLDPIEPGQGRRVVATRWARERVEDRELQRTCRQTEEGVDADIESLGLAFGIATRLTSFVAVSDAVDVDATSPTRRQTVPQAWPHGMSAEGVGLRRCVRARGGGFGADQSALQPSASTRVRGQAPPRAPGKPRFDSLGATPAKEERPRPTPEKRRKARAPRRRPRWLQGRIVHEVDGTLVIEVQIAWPVDWDPTAEVVLVDEDDQEHVVEPDATTTTAAGPLEPGRVARIVVPFRETTPVALRVGPLEISLS